MRPDTFFSLFFLFLLLHSSFFSFFFFFFFSIKHIWLRAVSGFGFLIHSDFLVEVVVVLRVVGSGCGFLGLPLVVVELGLKSRKEKNTRVAAMIFCVVSVYGSILAESEVKN